MWFRNNIYIIDITLLSINDKIITEGWNIFQPKITIVR